MMNPGFGSNRVMWRKIDGAFHFQNYNFPILSLYTSYQVKVMTQLRSHKVKYFFEVKGNQKVKGQIWKKCYFEPLHIILSQGTTLLRSQEVKQLFEVKGQIVKYAILSSCTSCEVKIMTPLRQHKVKHFAEVNLCVIKLIFMHNVAWIEVL